MDESIVSIGDKLHIITRRLFEEEVRRHFAGEVMRFSDGLYELEGYTFVLDTSTNTYEKRPAIRTRIFALGHPGIIVIRIPKIVSLNALVYRQVNGRLVITDGNKFSLDINEFGSRR